MSEDLFKVGDLFNVAKNDLKYVHNYFSIATRYVAKNNSIQLDLSYMQKRNIVSHTRIWDAQGGGSSPTFSNTWIYYAETNLDYIGLRFSECYHKHTKTISKKVDGAIQIGGYLHFDILASQKSYNHYTRHIKRNNSNMNQEEVVTLDTTSYAPFEPLKVSPLYVFAGITVKRTIFFKSFFLEYGLALGRSFNFRTKLVNVMEENNKTSFYDKLIAEVGISFGYNFKRKP